MIRFSAFFFFRPHGFKHYSTLRKTSVEQKPHLIIINYLIDSLRFSEQEAISVSSKGNLSHLKSTSNFDSLLHTFTNCGLNLLQIREIVSSVPKILTCNADTTLQPKLRVFKDLGLSGSDLVNLIKKNPQMFQFGLHTRIIPGVDLLKRILGDDENVVKFINKSRWLFCSNYIMNRSSSNVLLLQNIGLSADRITMFMLINPAHIMADTKLFENRVHYVEESLGISPALPNFIHALYVVLYKTDSQIEKKKQVFRSFGWSDSDITLLFRVQPYCFNKTEGNIRRCLEFYTHDMGYASSYLIRCSSFFTFSLNKRVIPRYKTLEILKEKKLVKDRPTLASIVKYSELKFLAFLKGFEKDIPGLCEIYMDSVRRVLEEDG